MIVEVTGPRRLENGLVVPGKFTAFTKGAAIGRTLIMLIKGTDTENNCASTRRWKPTISDLTEKKCFTTCIVVPVQLKLKRLEMK